MREPSDIGIGALPRPGRTLKAVLGTIAGFAVAGWLLHAWGPRGLDERIYDALAFRPAEALTRPWTLLTSGILTSTVAFSHALWALVGLYFLTPDLEKRWGGLRLLRFLALGIVAGNLLVLAVSKLPIGAEVFHPIQVFGPMAAIGAVSMAWARENKHAQIRFFFFLPMSGKTLYWATLALSIAPLVFRWDAPEGAAAYLGGAAAGAALGGTPSPVRSLWLGLKLKLLRRQSERALAEMNEPASSQRRVGDKPSKRSGKAPPLRVVYGGLEDELKNRKPPKDKRYLN